MREKPIHSRIVGDFEGWEGETVFPLENGQLWQQVGWDFQDGYAYQPRVAIRGGVMAVEGVRKTVRVVRLR